ncbi:Isochorismatase domain-containing protein [Rhizoctonia solani AG-1 IA]|uniref:Isochorismatase domain-containing protein n=1 Tax=Thanatephorus cucumeris (strain AG1-IA) TaxID=983506 RepID=L8X251_THACA|nr:Isochorismatase domain-containing protein [Rhizoctonia solani AG-1 IA]
MTLRCGGASFGAFASEAARVRFTVGTLIFSYRLRRIGKCVIPGHASPFFLHLLHTTTYGSLHTWIEDPSGLVDLSPNSSRGLEFAVLGDRRVRVDPGKTALVIVDMQNRNWGLEESDLALIPPCISRCFSKPKLGKWIDPPGLGADLGPKYGRILMKGEWNTRLYEGLEYEAQDSWVNKTRYVRSFGLFDVLRSLERKLKEMGIRTLLFAGVNADQCVLGTVTEAFSRGYDAVVIEDLVATTSPDGGKSNLVFNALHPAPSFR